MPNITIEVRNVYGLRKIYPYCQNAKIFADIAGTTTLSLADVRRIERLGYDICSVADADYTKAV